MSNFKAGLLALMIPAALAAPALAQQAPEGQGGPRFIFEEMDVDGNGAVTLEEMQAAGENRFANRDTDGDGALSREELIAGAQERVEERVDRMLERVDTDGDGQLTMAELEEAQDGRRRGPNPERIFNRLDADGDGSVTEAEFDEGVANFMERMGRRHGGRGHRG